MRMHAAHQLIYLGKSRALVNCQLSRQLLYQGHLFTIYGKPIKRLKAARVLLGHYITHFRAVRIMWRNHALEALIADLRNPAAYSLFSSGGPAKSGPILAYTVDYDAGLVVSNVQNKTVALLKTDLSPPSVAMTREPVSSPGWLLKITSPSVNAPAKISLR
jgi:hypothetical protein